MLLLKSPFNTLRALAIAACAAICAISVVHLAHAQSTPPIVTNVGASDLFQDVVNGTPQAPSYYASAAQINGVIGYTNAGVLATAQSLTFGNATQLIAAQSAGTIATLTLTASPNPGDGQLNCYINTQTTTAITWNANSTVSAQTISGAPSAGVANTKACMLFSKALGGWIRAQ